MLVPFFSSAAAAGAAPPAAAAGAAPPAGTEANLPRPEIQESSSICSFCCKNVDFTKRDLQFES